jgi:hypothetical protein
MKAKTLLIAAAALAAGVISSQAQVYSQNVVGYANVGTPVGGHEYLITVPFVTGVSNGVNEVFGSTLPVASSLLIWTGTGYNTYVYDPTDPDNLGAGAPVWYLGDDATPAVPLPTVAVGQGFFLIPSSPITNTFVGTVAVNVGTSNNLALPTGGHEYLVASVVPYAGSVTNGNNSTGGPNLNNLPVASSLLIWNGTGFNTAVYDPTDPDNLGANAPLWYQGDDATPYVDPSTGGNVPSIAVGQSFFVVPSASYTWKTGL